MCEEGDGNPVWEDVLSELQDLAATAEAGGMAAVEKKFKVTRPLVSPPQPEAEPAPDEPDTPSRSLPSGPL